MERFILRYRGGGTKPPRDVARIRAGKNVTVIDESSNRMLLVEGSAEELDVLLKTMPGWVMSEEQIISMPDPRPKIRSRAV